MSSPTVVENPLRQTRTNYNLRKKLNNSGLTKTRSWKNFGKTFLPKYGNSEVGKVGKKSKGLFGRFGTNKITGPENTTTKASNEISANIITNARTTNYDLIRRLWRQFKGKSNEIDFFPRIDTLEKIGKFELELECFKNKDNERNTSGRDSKILHFIYSGYSAEEANNILCNYTSQSTQADLKQRLIALKLPIDPKSTIIDIAFTTLTLPDELQKEKMKIVTNLIILRLILSDQLIVRLKSNDSKVVETSFGNLTTFGQVLKVASFLSLGVSILFFLPGVLLSEFPQEYMNFENGLDLSLNNNTVEKLQLYMIDFYKARYKTDASYSEMMQFATNYDEDSSLYFTDQMQRFITDNNRLPTLDEENTMILETNNKFPGIPKFYAPNKINDFQVIEWLGTLWNINYRDTNGFFFKFLKIVGIHGPILAVKSVIIGATSWSAVGGAVLIRKLHGLLKQYLSEKAKKDISDFIDRFLLEFPVAINLIRNPDYIKSFNTDTTLNLQIQIYINKLLKKLDDERREKLSQEERKEENTINTINAEKVAKVERQKFQGSILNNESAANETVTNETISNENTMPKPIKFENFTNATGGRRSYRQKKRSATKKRKTHRKN
jgi:hypothetical protein